MLDREVERAEHEFQCAEIRALDEMGVGYPISSVSQVKDSAKRSECFALAASMRIAIGARLADATARRDVAWASVIGACAQVSGRAGEGAVPMDLWRTRWWSRDAHLPPERGQPPEGLHAGW